MMSNLIIHAVVTEKVNWIVCNVFNREIKKNENITKSKKSKNK
jgi:hypothetical protein